MANYNYEGSEQFRPLSPWAYFGYMILFGIPLVGFILLIVFSLSDSNINRRNFARSFWCAYVLALIMIVVIIIAGASFATAFGTLGSAY